MALTAIKLRRLRCVTVDRSDNPEARLRVLICDDAALNRDCLALALRSHGFDTDCAWDLASFLGRIESGKPDIVLLNTSTPDSATLLRRSLDMGSGVRVIVIGLSENDESTIVSCAEAGVTGLQLRTDSLDQLLTLIAETAKGEPLSSPAIAAILMRRVYTMAGNPNAESTRPDLTDREDQILRLLEEGLSNQQIASRMHVSVHTVRNHAHSLFGKLGVNSRGEAVAAYRTWRQSRLGSA